MTSEFAAYHQKRPGTASPIRPSTLEPGRPGNPEKNMWKSPDLSCHMKMISLQKLGIEHDLINRNGDICYGDFTTETWILT